jgi:hypothetical protein
MITHRLYTFMCLFAAALFSLGAAAADLDQYTLDKDFYAVSPIYMAGHENDPEWIAGFNVSGDIYWNDALIGTVEGEIRLSNPPMMLSEVYDQAYLRISNTISGVGSFEVHAQGVAMGSSTPGESLFSWAGTVANGTGYFDGFYGQSAGTGIANVFAGNAESTEIVSLRSEY